jgi:hypothetical protein
VKGKETKREEDVEGRKRGNMRRKLSLSGRRGKGKEMYKGR